MRYGAVYTGKRFSVGEGQGNNFSAKAEIPLKNIADVHIGGGRTQGTEMLAGYEGDADLTVGIKAYRIFYRSGKYTIKQADDIERVRGDKFPGEEWVEDDFLIIEAKNG